MGRGRKRVAEIAKGTAGATPAAPSAGQPFQKGPDPRRGPQFQKGPDRRRGHGLKGRSGRKPDAFRKALQEIRDTAGLDVVREILAGKVTYVRTGLCGHCRTETHEETAIAIPSSDTRLRAAEMTMRYTVGLEKTIRLDGLIGAQEAFEIIRARIRTNLPTNAADALVADIETALREQL